MTRVLLSASYPDSQSQEWGSFSSVDIGLAASAVIEATLRRGWTLIFGGHPTITPLVLDVATTLHAGPQVEMIQSKFFRDEVTDTVLRLLQDQRVRVEWTKRMSDRDHSLKVMRSQMISKPIDFAMYVGGKTGIADEFHAVRTASPGVRQGLFVQPGGMAARLAESTSGSGVAEKLSGRAYGTLTTGLFEREARHA